MVCSTRHQPYDAASGVFVRTCALAAAPPEHDGVERASMRGRSVGLGSVERTDDRGNPVPQASGGPPRSWAGPRAWAALCGDGACSAPCGRITAPCLPHARVFGDRHLEWRLSHRPLALYPTFYGARTSGRYRSRIASSPRSRNAAAKTAGGRRKFMAISRLCCATQSTRGRRRAT
jgi:hypothetical protein